MHFIISDVRTAGRVALHGWCGHWRSLLHQHCQISESPFGTQRDISQMCLQLAGCSQHHPLTWNVSWAGDNLLGFLLSHHKNPSEARLCYGCPAHICGADSELQITKKATSEDCFSLSMWLVLAWLSYGLLLHVELQAAWWLQDPAGSSCNERVRWEDELARCTGEDSSAAGCVDETHAGVTVWPAAALKVVTDIMSWYSISIRLTNWMRKKITRIQSFLWNFIHITVGKSHNFKTVTGHENSRH